MAEENKVMNEIASHSRAEVRENTRIKIKLTMRKY
jgi:hypothetical protein